VYDALGTLPARISCGTLYSKPSPVRDWLTTYKGREDGSEPVDSQAQRMVTAMFARLLQVLQQRLAAAGVEAFVIVPSTARPAPHPLASVLAASSDLPVVDLLRRTEAPLGFNQPARDAYAINHHNVPQTGAGTIALIDDVYTTGARLNSAAHALRQGGIHIGTSIVMARRVNPQMGDPRAAAFWAQQTAQPFDWANVT
jgi:orotate phosphoribosyltransferase